MCIRDSIVANLLSPSDGIVNVLIKALGGAPVNFLASKEKFRTILVLSDLWHGMGWNTIIFLAALTNIDPQLYEAARIDGAGKLQQILHITLPGLKSTIIVLLLMKIGNLMNNGFEQIFLLYNPNVYEVADVFETYVYRIGLVDTRYDFATAVGLFKSCISFVMLVLSLIHIFWRSACPGDGAPAAFSQLRSVDVYKRQAYTC